MTQNKSMDEAREHAWDWFSLHASQRMQSFNFFLVATAFLVAGYATLLKDFPAIATGVAVAGAWMAFWFNRLENRTRQLVHAAEAVLAKIQERLAQTTQLDELRILERVKAPTSGASLYSQVIGIIQWSTVLSFVVAAVYAGSHIAF